MDVKSLLKTYLRDVSSKNKLDTTLDKYLINIQFDNSLKKISEIPFSSERKYSAIVYENFTLIMGAPGILAKNDVKLLTDVATYANEAYRVIVFGIALNKNLENFKPLALIAFEDPIREEAQETLDNLAKQQIQYRVISGDAAETVIAIIKKINKDYPVRPIDGEELGQLSGEGLEKAILEHNIFARIKPQQKQEIIKILKKNKLFTVMIGDGVNDVLAIKEADVGIAMNGGSAMAKDVADVVLLNNSFTTLPMLLAEGRRIITNIQTIANIYLIKNVSAIATVLMLGFIGLRFPYDPKHVELTSLLIVGIPSIFLALEKHNFYTTDEGFVKRLLLFSSIVGFGNAVIYTMLYTFYDIQSSQLFYARTILLTSTVFLGINNLFLIYLQHYSFEEILKRKIFMSLVFLIITLFIFINILSPIKGFFDIKSMAAVDIIIGLTFSLLGSMMIGLVLRNFGLLKIDERLE